jgi:c-di-GMP-binding flagellar brake protein YcgR
MSFARYFKPGQKVLLRVMEPPGRFEALTASFQEEGSDYFDLALPYHSEGGETYPFAPEMPLELMSDHLGLGVRLTCRFREQRNGNLIRVGITGGLQIFQRRQYRRVDATAGLRYTKGRGTLRSFREQWEKNSRILEATKDFSKLPPFPRTRINLSTGGMRFEIRAPVEVADLCLILLQLDPNARPFCILAEVVWLAEQQVDDRRAAGMRFVSILEADQKRLEAFVRERGAAEPPSKP